MHEAMEIAIRKARYGHNDWIVWTDREGVSHTARKTVENIKCAMLATGTHRHWYLITANSNHGHIVRWPMAVTMWRNARRGFA